MGLHQLSKPRLKFLRQMLYGIQITKSVILSKIAAEIDEDIKQVKIEMRLCHHLAFKDLWKHLHEAVMVHAKKFVRTTVERYHARKCLSFWNVWNEPRCRPVEECFCDECRKAYGNYLKARFGTIGALNAFYGVSEDSFEHIALTILTTDYADVIPDRVEDVKETDGVLSWAASKSADHRYYRVYRGGRQIASTVATSLKVGQKGDYAVRSVDKWLNVGK